MRKKTRLLWLNSDCKPCLAKVPAGWTPPRELQLPEFQARPPPGLAARLALACRQWEFSAAKRPIGAAPRTAPAVCLRSFFLRPGGRSLALLRLGNFARGTGGGRSSAARGLGLPLPSSPGIEAGQIYAMGVPQGIAQKGCGDPPGTEGRGPRHAL